MGVFDDAKAAAPGRSFGFLIAYLVGLSAFGSFVNDMYLPSLPSMMKFFGTTVSMVQLGLTTGMAGLAVGEMFMGPISDKYGRKPMLVYSLSAFIVASTVSIFSPNITFFLVCRFFQGLGASGGYFLARSIPADIYQGRLLAKTMAIIGAINGFAPASAPVFGGLISDHFTWKGVFWVLTGVGIILLCFAPKFKESLTPDKRQQGSLWSSFANYKKLVTNKKFMIHIFLKGAALGVVFAYISAGPFIFETHFGYSQTMFGVFMGGNALLVAAGSMVALKFRYLKTAAFAGALGLMVFSFVEAAVLWLLPHVFLAFELLLLPLLFCCGMIFTAGNTLAMNEGRATAGDASALLGIVGYVFGAVVSPLIGQGDVLHTTAIAISVISIITFVMAIFSYRLAPEMDGAAPQNDTRSAQ